MKRYQPIIRKSKFMRLVHATNVHEESLIGGSCGQKFITQKSRYLLSGPGPSVGSII